MMHKANLLTETYDKNEIDLSHPIHADNCLLDPEANECWKEPPAYTYRDYRYENTVCIFTDLWEEF